MPNSINYHSLVEDVVAEMIYRYQYRRQKHPVLDDDFDPIASAAVEDAMSTLTDRQQAVLRNRYSKQPMSFRKIAAIIGLSGAETVRYHHRRGLRRLGRPARLHGILSGIGVSAREIGLP